LADITHDDPACSDAPLAEQAGSRDHEPGDKDGYARKQQEIAQDCRHGEASPLRSCAGSDWHTKAFSSTQYSTLELHKTLAHPSVTVGRVLLGGRALGASVVQSANVHNVDTVLVDGRIVKRGGKLVAYDVDKIVLDAKASALEQ
jgi:hypothetical protein